MKEFWVKMSDKNRFVESMGSRHFWETREPYFDLIKGYNGITNTVVKYYHYRVDITDEEYLFLKLQFDLKDEV